MLQKRCRDRNRPAKDKLWRPRVLTKSFRYASTSDLQETNRLEDVDNTLSSAAQNVSMKSSVRQAIPGGHTGLGNWTRRQSHLFDDNSWPLFCNLHTTEDILSPNPFVFDINIHLDQRADGQSRKVLKRVLLDTGSDLNLISAPAHADLKTSTRSSRHSVRSVAGESSVVGETHLQWSFISSKSGLNSKPALFSDVFFVLSRREAPLFDCILSRHWIQANRSTFLSLWADEQQKQP